MRAIVLLAVWSIKNAVRSSLTDPKRLIPLLFVGFWLAVQVLGLSLSGSRRRPSYPPQAAEWVAQNLDLFSGGVFVVLVLVAVGIIEHGFGGGFLAFSMGDVDYLFPSPIARRVILAFRLSAKTALAFLRGAFLFYVAVWNPVQAFSGGRVPMAGFFAGLCALFFCLGGYANAALALKLFSGFTENRAIRRALGGLLAGLLLLTGYLYWKGGWAGVAAVAQNGLVAVLFYPCHLAADAVVSPLAGQVGVAPLGPLALFYFITLALVFARDINYYEASLEGSERSARLLQAARDQDWSAIFAIQAEAKQRQKGGRPKWRGVERPYTLPAFGTGAAALLWAHLCAAAKRPGPSFALPLVGGIGLAVLATHFLGKAAALAVAVGSGYLLFILTSTSLPAFRQGLLRQGLVRPLPLKEWQVVLVEVAPRLLTASLFAWGAGLTLWISGVPFSNRVGPLVVVCFPFALMWLLLIQYVVAVWYPDGQDKLQQLIAGFVDLLLMAVAMGIMALFIVVPLFLGAPDWLTALVFILPSTVLTALLLLGASVVYKRYQPRQ